MERDDVMEGSGEDGFRAVGGKWRFGLDMSIHHEDSAGERLQSRGPKPCGGGGAVARYSPKRSR